MSTTNRPDGHDSDYLTRREAQERLAAEQSVDLAARRVHEVLADQYAKKAQDSRGIRRLSPRAPSPADL